MAIVIRENAERMSTAKWNRFVDSLNEYKKSGEYDKKTQHHANAMRTLTPWFVGETGTGRNVAHRGPAFFPWHRQALRELELALIDIQGELFPFDAPVGIPYWRWNANTSGWRTATIWNRVGGNGNSSDGWRINTGPFRSWNSTIISGSGFATRRGIIRKFKTSGSMPSWGNTGIATYDTSPWSEKSSGSQSYRQFFEGKHNSVHTLVGGDMTAPTSPNDPLFWLHHCNVDRAWARWQNVRGIQTSFRPSGEGPSGHNEDDVPMFLDSADASPPKTISEMLDWRNIDWPGSGFNYDTLNP